MINWAPSRTASSKGLLLVLVFVEELILCTRETIGRGTILHALGSRFVDGRIGRGACLLGLWGVVRPRDPPLLKIWSRDLMVLPEYLYDYMGVHGQASLGLHVDKLRVTTYNDRYW